MSNSSTSAVKTIAGQSQFLSLLMAYDKSIPGSERYSALCKISTFVDSWKLGAVKHQLCQMVAAQDGSLDDPCRACASEIINAALSAVHVDELT